MGARISLDYLPAGRRFHHFRDIAASLYVPVSLTCERPEIFRFNSDELAAGDLSFAPGFMTKVKVARTPRDVAHSESDSRMKLILPIAGAIGVRQDRREALIRPGQFFVDDPMRPYEEHILDDLSYMAVHLPRHAVISRVGGLDTLTAIGFGPESPHCKLALDFLSSLSSVWHAVDKRFAVHLGSVALELIVAALRERSDRATTANYSYKSAQFQRAKAFIDSHLQDPSLSLSLVATALGASVRHVSALLSERGLSYRRYVLEQRLQRCANDLADVRFAHRTVTAIAYSWGFSDGSHFSNAFKAARGVSPREYRSLKLCG
jgi:AraC-like DNA-binding protein